MTPKEIERTIVGYDNRSGEAIFAAGLRPLDLNNMFITSGIASHSSKRPSGAASRAIPARGTRASSPPRAGSGSKRIAAVVQGDCANTHALVEMLRADSVEIVPFAFPYSPADSALLELALDRFAAALGATRQEAEDWKAPLDRARSLAHRMDVLNWRENRATGAEQHLWTISCSDFFGDPERYAARASERIAECAARPPDERSIRLGLLGVPPICDGFFELLESHGARVVFNEIPRQFAMPQPTRSLVEQYSRYTYPYDIFHRLADIREQLALRRVRG